MAEEEAESPKRMPLKTVDDNIFEVSPLVEKEMQRVQSFMDDTDSSIPLPNVHSRQFSKIIDYCNHHCRFQASKAVAANDDTSAGASSRSNEAARR